MRHRLESREKIGGALLGIAVLAGLVATCLLFAAGPASAEDPVAELGAMGIGALLAFPCALVYLVVPRLLDRYDPEPWYALVGCLLWGAFVAAPFSAPVNDCVAGVAGEAVAVALSAPVVEEAWKAIGILGVFYFLRREFDGVVDGVIYGTFIAIGFAAVENVLYYERAAREGGGTLALVFTLRGIVGPWGHPLYTAMTGIGLGLAREAESTAVRWFAPLAGYGGAVLLHATWNGSALFFQSLGNVGGLLFLASVAVWLLFLAGFMAVMIVLVRRRGRVIRDHLVDEVVLGYVHPAERDMASSAFGLYRARIRYGPIGAEIVRATARLALAKWHVGRAAKRQAATMSIDFVVPLRQKIHELRRQLPTPR